MSSRLRAAHWRGALCAAASLALAPAAAALELELVQPTPCPLEELSFRVERLLGQPPAEPPGLSFRVRVQRSGPWLEGKLDVSEAGGRALGERRMLAPSCDELTEALALSIVLAIGASREASDSEGTPAVSAAASAAPLPSPTELSGEEDAAVAPPAPPAASAAPRLGTSAGLALDSGALPVPGVGVVAGLDVSWPSAQVRALGSWFPERSAPVDAPGRSSAGAELGLFAAALLGCVPLATQLSSLQIAACGGWELGRLSGHGTGVDVPHSASVWWSALRVDAAARWALPVRPLQVELALAALTPLTRDEFELREIGTVHRPANLIGRAQLGLRLDLSP